MSSARSRSFIEQDSRDPDSAIRARLADTLSEIGRQLGREDQLRADMNHGFVVALSAFVEDQKSGVSRFIAEQVRGWDMAQMTKLIELNIGKDLQYIRFNGMVIGGIAGLLLHVAELMIFSD
jgi:uncharacterized membrane-anchored protein YjiN (DUF445 family)